MDKTTRELLMAEGLEIDSTLERFSGNEMLYGKYLFGFPDEPAYMALVKAIEEDDREEIRHQVHTLKGISGNLGMADLYMACSEIMIILNRDINEDIGASYKKLQDCYEQIVEFLKNNRYLLESMED